MKFGLIRVGIVLVALSSLGLVGCSHPKNPNEIVADSSSSEAPPADVEVVAGNKITVSQGDSLRLPFKVTRSGQPVVGALVQLEIEKAYDSSKPVSQTVKRSMSTNADGYAEIVVRIDREFPQGLGKLRTKAIKNNVEIANSNKQIDFEVLKVNGSDIAVQYTAFTSVARNTGISLPINLAYQGAPLANAPVQIKITRPGGTDMILNQKSDAQGNVEFNFRFPRENQAGIGRIEIQVLNQNTALLAVPETFEFEIL